MKLLRISLLVLLIGEALAQDPQCTQIQLSGDATQAKSYNQQLDEHLMFSVVPIRLREDPQWAWFQIRVFPNDGNGIFVFHPGDRNWILDATDWSSASIGGVSSDLNTALQYRSRYIIFPVAADDKQRTREAANLIREAKTSEQVTRAVAALNAVPLAQLQFEITDYALSEGQHPMSVESVKFDLKLTVPSWFRFSEKIPSTFVPCPTIPTELVENIRNPKRHEYLLVEGNNPKQ